MRVSIIGAGIGGLSAAAILSHAGLEVSVFETAAAPGGKLHETVLGEVRIDSGPTVFTMRPVFDEIFGLAGARLEDHLALEKLDCLARHAWDGGGELDLFAEPARNEAAIRTFAGADAAAGYAAFADRSRKIYETLDAPFMRAEQPGLLGLMRAGGPGLLQISPFVTLWDELGKFFPDPRLRQLFGRYATYCGASPFTAPATLMLIAHAELLGVWKIAGGMVKLAFALEAAAKSNGAEFNYETKVDEILAAGRVTGIRAGGERIATDAVIANADLAALDAGYFGAAAKQAVAGLQKGAKRSLSARTWALTGTDSGFPLAHHNVFFSRDYRAEFAAINAGAFPSDPTIYLCHPGPGTYFCLVNAAPDSDAAMEYPECQNLVLQKLQRSGLTLKPSETAAKTPRDWEAKFPATGGALYGRALTGWKDPFARPGARTRLPGLYLAGGSIHPGPGLPIAATSGRLAAQRLMADFGLTQKSQTAAMPGGTSMR